MSATREIEDPSTLTVGKRLKFLAKDSVVYGGAAALSQSLSLFTFPLLARHFSVADYGLIDFFNVLVNFLTILLVFGQDSAVARFFYEYKDAPVRKQVVTQSLLVQLGYAALALLALWIFSDRVAGRLHDSPQSALLFKLILIQVPFQLLINFSQNILKWTFSRVHYLAISLGSVVARVSALFAALFFWDLDVARVFWINVGVSAIFGILGMIFVRGWLTRPAGFRILKDLLLFAVPLGIVCSVGAFVPATERWIVSGLLGEKDLGLYAAGSKIAMLISMPIQAFQMAWGPFSLAIHKEADAAATYNWILKALTWGLCLGVLSLAAVAGPALRLLATERFAGAAVVVFPLAMGLALQAIGWIPGIGISISKKTVLNLYAYLLYAAVSVAAIFSLARAFGIFGVAYGTLCGHAAKAFMESYFGQKAWRIEWQFGGIVAVPLFTIAIGITAHIARAVFPYGQTLMLAISVPAVFAIGWKYLFSPENRAKITGMLRSRLQGKGRAEA